MRTTMKNLSELKPGDRVVGWIKSTAIVDVTTVGDDRRVTLATGEVFTGHRDDTVSVVAA